MSDYIIGAGGFIMGGAGAGGGDDDDRKKTDMEGGRAEATSASKKKEDTESSKIGTEPEREEDGDYVLLDARLVEQNVLLLEGSQDPEYLNRKNKGTIIKKITKMLPGSGEKKEGRYYANRKLNPRGSGITSSQILEPDEQEGQTESGQAEEFDLPGSYNPYTKKWEGSIERNIKIYEGYAVAPECHGCKRKLVENTVEICLHDGKIYHKQCLENMDLEKEEELNKDIEVKDLDNDSSSN